MPNIQERIRKGAEVGVLPRMLYRLELSPESREKIANLKVKLADNPNMALMVYFNHFAFDDPFWIAHLISRIDPRQKRRIVAPASYSHIDPNRNGSKVFRRIHEEAGRCGIETIPIIQTYQVRNPNFGYTEQQASSSYKKLLRRLDELKKSGVPLAVIIAPEGHRSETGNLGGAEEGIVHIGNLLAPVLCVPVGIVVKDENPQRDSLNIGRRIVFNIGETWVQEERMGGQPLEYYMRELAKTLPRERRGRWDLREI